MLRIQAAEGGRTAARRRRAQEATSANPGASRVPIKELSRKSAGGGIRIVPEITVNSNKTLSLFSPKTKQFCRFTSLLVASAALFVGTGQAKAAMSYNIFESGGNVVIEAAGTLDLTGASQIATNTICGADGAIVPSMGLVCTGPDALTPTYSITGPNQLSTSSGGFVATTISGMFTILWGGNSEFGISSAYASGNPIISSATFNGQTLASMGFTTTTGLIGTWTLDGTSETIQVVLGQPSAAVPGHLPLLGAGAAFGWSRRLRKRITTPLSTLPQA